MTRGHGLGTLAFADYMGEQEAASINDVNTSPHSPRHLLFSSLLATARLGRWSLQVHLVMPCSKLASGDALQQRQWSIGSTCLQIGTASRVNINAEMHGSRRHAAVVATCAARSW